eukprot:1323835-Amorphochlora_amoeboformis.AAC.1
MKSTVDEKEEDFDGYDKSTGGVHGKPSNYSLFMSLGGRGLDTALLYGDDVQIEVGKAVR